MTRTIRRLGFAFLLLGVTSLVVGTIGFSSVSADRTVNVTIADDPNAYLGVHDNSNSSDANITGSADTGEVYYLDDNVDEFTVDNVSVEIVEIEYEDGTVNTDPGLRTTIRSADLLDGLLSDKHDFYVEIECSDGSNEQGSIYVTLDFSAKNGITIDLRRTTNERIGVDCTS